MKSISADPENEIVITKSQIDLIAIQTLTSMEPPEIQAEIIPQGKVTSLKTPESQKDIMSLQVIKEADTVPSFLQNQMEFSQTTQNTNSMVDQSLSQDAQSLLENIKPSQHILEMRPLSSLLPDNQLRSEKSPEAYQLLLNQIRTPTPNPQTHQKTLRLLTKFSNPKENAHLILTPSPKDPHKLVSQLSRHHTLKSPLSVKEVLNQTLNCKELPLVVQIQETGTEDGRVLPFLPSLISSQCPSVPHLIVPLAQHLPKIPGSNC
ncbi:unnamed protein product [Meganyctiphanes norvegica]|uniref:Uncharacterized protein n=1 Tax=Meganyctiphanes norvegica TaxID=48144 RepID=A0AAV2QKW2_MEGNR